MTLDTSDTTVAVSDNEFRWREWRLGEGEFAAEGPRSEPRPNFGYGGPGQKPIPKIWWSRLEAFLERRKPRTRVTKMMLARLVALDYAHREAKAGVRETGGNNLGKRVELYQAADDLPGGGYAWCASFVQWCFKVAGQPLPKRTASVGFLLSDARIRGWVETRPFRGDLVCYQFTSDNWPDHIGFVDKVLRLGPVLMIRTVEGNTSSGDAGSQDEGDGVYVRTRVVRASRVSFIRVPGSVKVEVLV